MNDEQFDQLLNEIREEHPSAEETAAAKARVRERLASSTSSSLCEGFRANLRAYLDHDLAASRRLLLEDHLGRCADCRRALAEAQGDRPLPVIPVVTSRRPAWIGWAMAAGILIAGLYLGRDTIDRALAAPGPRATVVSVAGDVFRLPEGKLAPGAELFEDDVLRTGAAAHAVLQLADGSRLEVNQRTKLSVHAAWSGQTVRLDYGDVLMEAAKQRRGRLRVVTWDSVASVKGTIFAVSSATAGSLVSVVEGAVEVSQPGTDTTLTPGEQAASTVALDSVSIEQALAWSEDSEKYFSVLAEIMGIEKDLAAAPGPALRTEPRLLAYLPAGTQAYLAIPNLHGTIQQALVLMDQRAAENETLREWWSSEDVRDLRETIDRIQQIAPLLGDEVVFLHAGDPGAPLVLAEIQDGREEELRTAIAELAGDHEVSYEIADGLLLVSDNAEHLTMMDASLGGDASSPFAQEIALRYENGVSWLTAVNVKALTAEAADGNDEAAIFGVSTMSYLFFEQGAEGNDATLSFNGSRTGIASWLATPGPAGSAEYVSSEAVAAFSASMRDPRELFDEIIAQLDSESQTAAELAEFEAETGVSVGLDIAASLGTDVTFAVERPAAPLSGWFVAVEALNPGALDEAARRLVDAYNVERQQSGDEGPQLTYAVETVNGVSWRSVAAVDGSEVLHWTYDRGYLIASMDRALAARAIAVRESGSPLIHTSAFQQRFPPTSGLHHSGFFWFNTNGVVAELASMADSPALRGLLDSRDPLLVIFDGEAERIHAASRNRLTGVLLDAVLVNGIPRESDSEQP
jgi:ferric-dicitrate binding protein FerR (iron transport regulator)